MLPHRDRFADYRGKFEYDESLRLKKFIASDNIAHLMLNVPASLMSYIKYNNYIKRVKFHITGYIFFDLRH